jgi:hypothetical protein
MFQHAPNNNGRSNPNMKKITTWKRPSLIAYFVLIFIVLLYTFKSQIMPYYFQIQFRSPIVFHNVRITFPKGMIFSAEKEIIGFHYWENPNAFLYIGKMNSYKMKKESLIQFFEKKNFHILETNDIPFKDYRSFTISYMDSSWKYNKAIYVIPMNLRITYQGTREHYKDFKNIIDSMEFL